MTSIPDHGRLAEYLTNTSWNNTDELAAIVLDFFGEPEPSPTRCEDYPCCGHTDGLGCNYDTSYYSSDKYHAYLNLHYGCDHEAGWCCAYTDEED